MNAQYSSCAWADLAHAGWQPRVTGRNHDQAVITFTGPEGQAEIREVPVDRLGKNLRNTLERNFQQQRKVVLKAWFR
jgi:hypothetical protein